MKAIKPAGKTVKKNSLKPAPGQKPFPMAGKGGGFNPKTPVPAFKKGGMVKGKC